MLDRELSNWSTTDFAILIAENIESRKMISSIVETPKITDIKCHEVQNNIGYLAKPSGNCCLKGSIHTGEPRGAYTTIAGVETYVATPTKSQAHTRILLYFPDVWGLFNNGLLVMDGFADAGYLVLGLDYFRDVSYDLMACRANV